MDNGSVVIARIPNPNVGTVSKVLASEVATMDFVHNVFHIPMPKILAWDGGNSNSAESEYILMEPAKGMQLEEQWEDMTLDAKFKVVDDVVVIQQKLQSVSFSKYGNIYFKSDAFEGCCKLEISGDLSETAKTYAEDQFVIGPVSEKEFWETRKISPLNGRGPWSHAKDYLRAIAQRERSKMPSSETSISDSTSENAIDIDSPLARLSLLDKFDAITRYLPPTNQNLNKATLSHWDLRAPNIFVENGQITSLIDWQDVWVGPFFMQERRPKLVEYHGELILRLPDYYETMEDKEEKAKLADQVERSLVSWYYGEQTKPRNPDLQDLFDLRLARTRREVVLFASEVWDGETVLLRESLYKLERHWDKLDTGVPCPIHFTSEEIGAHDQASAGWNDRADFWSSLAGFVSRDGYVSAENYDQAREMFAELREAGLAQLKGAEMEEFAEQSQWAKRPV